jgi:hypothetical protein
MFFDEYSGSAKDKKGNRRRERGRDSHTEKKRHIEKREKKEKRKSE